MILARLDNVTVYRMHAPKWAVAPTSGAGAAKHGGRLNRPGVEALYLALAGAKGILFPSQLADGSTNLVLYSELLADTDSIVVYDPGQALPKNQDSWL